MSQYIVVIPYSETSRLFHASKTVTRESYLGGDDCVVYYESHANKMSEVQAKSSLASLKNKSAFIRKSTLGMVHLNPQQ